jgi:hypothetical protein
MAQFAKLPVLQNGVQYLKDNVTIAYICKAPLLSDSLAQIQTKGFASVAYSSADITITSSGDDLLMTSNGKADLDPSDTATAGEDIAVVFCSGTEVLACIDATDRIITNEISDTIAFPINQFYSRNWSLVA